MSSRHLVSGVSVVNNVLIRRSEYFNFSKRFVMLSGLNQQNMQLGQRQSAINMLFCRYLCNGTTFPYSVLCYHRSKFRFLRPESMVRNDRRGYKGGKHKKEDYEEGSSSDSESDDDEDVEDLGDDSDAPAGYKVMKLHVKSLRVDSIVSGGLDIARNRVDETFFANRLRLNGNKLTKKSKQMSPDDYVDVIIEKLEDVVKVKRVKIVKISSEKTRTDKFTVLARVWKNPFEIESREGDKW